MLEVKQVSKLYENARGVHNIDFSMQRGEIVGFLGPNGAGKTTTMRMITGYLNPTHGQIWVDGHSMADNPKKARRKIGYLPETPPLYPEMTVQAYLRFIANLRDVPAREQKLRVGEAIDKLGLQGREKQIIRSLSKGYKQRLGLAQAILHQPDLLILDEPTSGLDPKQIIEIRQLIHELGENHTVLLSTHILPEINAICNRVLIINQGRVVLDERPENLGRTMGETFEVSLEVKGPRERILTELRSLEAVGEVKELDAPVVSEPVAAEAGASADAASAPAASVKLLVTSADRSDIREDLFFRLAGAGYPILEMKRESLSLEDIFLKLTTDEPAATDSAAAPDADSKEEVDTDA
ncbi:multidrug ABC transporter ATP-binding protein [Paenibacillus marchantiophytorum]|uniref:Multidrug ABC transporter ATP-binding protein n=1 Tax=Paenibacillus marchantiophytorum TaxID=1619310 RepID=A0ABQ1F3Z5_9BACL|nr:ATP-binding cassette domain-containing protein [Paenibacillus marchantiophytorum]GFZ97953.1 multidrug ABC transporter ATP-binding protein [Paenibacillus marchantiophytorum]